MFGPIQTINIDEGEIIETRLITDPMRGEKLIVSAATAAKLADAGIIYWCETHSTYHSDHELEEVAMIVIVVEQFGGEIYRV